MTQKDVLAGLVPPFRTKVEALLTLCDEAGFRAVAYQGYRSPAEQARLWAQSRSRAEVEREAARLKAAGADYLAGLLEKAPAGGGPRVTNALPGQSWHQFGRAIDCYIESPETGRALWRDRRMDGAEFGLATQLYERLGRIAESLGLTWGGRWALGDYGHVQLDRANSPISAFASWRSLSEQLAKAAAQTPEQA